MVHQLRKLPPALKHGAYSTTAVLPGEDRAAYEKLRKGLIAELAPAGVLEESIVADLARLIWRKENVGTFRAVELAGIRYSETEFGGGWGVGDKNEDEHEQGRSERAQAQLGELYPLVDMGKFATLSHHAEELQVIERLDCMIDRSLKRLLFVRGVKSMAGPVARGGRVKPSE